MQRTAVERLVTLSTAGRARGGRGSRYIAFGRGVRGREDHARRGVHIVRADGTDAYFCRRWCHRAHAVRCARPLGDARGEMTARTNKTVSVIICTRNHVSSLRSTLASVATVQVPRDFTAELIVVDNASDDGTRRVTEEAAVSNMPVRYLFEGRPGKGLAYNAATAAASGGVLLFTDDDVRFPPNWVDGMCRPIVEGLTDAVAGGVRLAPGLERPWMSAVTRGWLASTESVDSSNPGRLVGANMAFSARVLERVPLFDPELG